MEEGKNYVELWTTSQIFLKEMTQATWVLILLAKTSPPAMPPLKVIRRWNPTTFLGGKLEIFDKKKCYHPSFIGEDTEMGKLVSDRASSQSWFVVSSSVSCGGYIPPADVVPSLLMLPLD